MKRLTRIAPRHETVISLFPRSAANTWIEWYIVKEWTNRGSIRHNSIKSIQTIENAIMVFRIAFEMVNCLNNIECIIKNDSGNKATGPFIP